MIADAAGMLRIGRIAEFLSKPIISGFIFGLSIVVIIGEVATLLKIGPKRFLSPVAPWLAHDHVLVMPAPMPRTRVGLVSLRRTLERRRS